MLFNCEYFLVPNQKDCFTVFSMTKHNVIRSSGGNEVIEPVITGQSVKKMFSEYF